MQIERLGPDDVDRVMAASALFDHPVDREHTARFLTSPGHHLFMAREGDTDIGFISGVETTHPDKGTEMFLYELGVDPAHQGKGAGSALVAALRDLAKAKHCHGMWVGTEADNEAALATYRSTGAEEPEPCVTLTWTF